MAARKKKRSKALGQAGKNCRCPSGTRKKSTKGRGRGFVCIGETNNAPRFVKKTKSGGCPSGSRMKQTARGKRCFKRTRGPKFVAPVCR